MGSFLLFKKRLAPIEGGFVPKKVAASINDRGGETYKGIARNFHPNWEGWAIVDAWKKQYGGDLPWKFIIPDSKLDAMVDKFYKTLYWDTMRGDEVKNQSLIELIADWGVNSGDVTARKQVQKALGLVADGVFGPKTMAVLNGKNLDVVFNKIKEARRAFIDGNPNIDDKIEPVLIRDRVDSFFFHPQPEKPA